MDEHTTVYYQPPKDFVEDERDSLIDIHLTDSTELWLFQWPFNQPADFDGQQFSLKLKNGRQLGTLEGSSGKSYDVVDVNYQGPEAVVFVSSVSETRVAGKISKHLSLIHYPEPSELKQRRDIHNRSHSQRSSAATSTMSGRRTAQSSRTRSTVTGSAGHSKSSKRKRIEEQSKSGQSSGKGNSGITSSGSKGHSVERTSKKRKEN